MPQDLRRTNLTVMPEFGVTQEILERSQNHLLSESKMHRHYLHHDYIKEKRKSGACWEPNWKLFWQRHQLTNQLYRQISASGEFS